MTLSFTRFTLSTIGVLLWACTCMAQGHWIPTTDASAERFGAVPALLQDGQVLVVGGQNNFGSLASCEIFNPTTETWAPAQDMSIDRTGHAVVNLNDGRIMAIGGNSFNFGTLSSAEIYDPSTNSWTSTPDMTDPRQSHNAIVLADGRVLVTGGLAGFFGEMATSEIYDPVTNTWTAGALMNSGRSQHNSVLLPSGKVLVSGSPGFFGPPSPFADIYDPQTDTWTTTQAMTAFSAHTLVMNEQDQVVAIGGRDNNFFTLGVMEIFDETTNSWNPGPDPVLLRVQPQAFKMPNGELVLFGGQADLGQGFDEWTTHTEIYNSTTDEWNKVSDASIARQGAFTIQLQDGRILTGGGQDPNGFGFLTSSEIFDPTKTDPFFVKPTLLTPANGAVGEPSNLALLDWEDIDGAVQYIIQYGTDETFDTQVKTETSIASEEALSGLKSNTEYFWRVRITNLVDAGSWSDTWSFTTGLPLGDDDPLAENKLTVFPNPSTGTVQIQGADRLNAVVLLDLSGKQVYAKQFSTAGNTNLSINLNHLPAGSYIIELQAESGSTRDRFILLN